MRTVTEVKAERDRHAIARILHILDEQAQFAEALHRDNRQHGRYDDAALGIRTQVRLEQLATAIRDGLFDQLDGGDSATDAFVEADDAERYAQRDEYVNSDALAEQQAAQERWFATEVLGLDGTAIDRAQWLADARALLDFIEANPAISLPPYHSIEISYHPIPQGDVDDAVKMAAIDEIADLLGVTVTTPDVPGSHYEARIYFGSASYKAAAVLKRERDKYDAVQRLGMEALAELRNQAESVSAR
jgi:hypothetical protein